MQRALCAFCAWLLTGCAFPLAHAEASPHRHARNARQAPQHASTQQRPWGRELVASRAEPRDAHLPRPVIPAPSMPEPADCYDALSQAGIAFERIPDDEANAVDMAVRLMGPVGGVFFASHGKKDINTVLDCRLALRLLKWAPTLKRAGINRIEHYSMFRPGARVRGGRKVSGHAHGMAIDAARFYLADGSMLDVEKDWQERERGGSPCPVRDEENTGSQLLRKVVCEAVDEQLFSVVITPHHNHAHDNHVHLELKPEVDWTYVR